MNPLSEGNSLLYYRPSNYIAKSILFLLSKETVNDITVNIRKATKKCLVLKVLSMQLSTCLV